MAKEIRKFTYNTLVELRKEIKQLDITLPISKRVHNLNKQCKIGNRIVANSLCINPMEGCDAERDGSPSALTYRKYRRYARGGAGIIWVEATAVTEDGKSNPRQLYLNEESFPGFVQLSEEINKAARNNKGTAQEPFTVLQLTHSGRHSAPSGAPEPVIAKHSELLDKKYDISPDYPVITDSALDDLKEKFVHAARLASFADFDAVDIKACHGYLLHELLFAYEEESSKYRGKFERRVSFLIDLIKAIKNEVPELTLATRLNLYDRVPYPDGWGMAKDGSLEPDLSEPIKFIKQLKEVGLEILNVAVGNPYYDPFLERPYDQPVSGAKLPDEHPLEAISINLEVTAEVSEQFPYLFKIGGGLSWLREFFPYVAAAMKESGWIDAIGVGRAALANPNFANELIKHKELERERLCITCSSCTQMMRDGVEVGCLMRDGEMYGPVYRKGRRKAKEEAKS